MVDFYSQQSGYVFHSLEQLGCASALKNSETGFSLHWMAHVPGFEKGEVTDENNSDNISSSMFSRNRSFCGIVSG